MSAVTENRQRDDRQRDTLIEAFARQALALSPLLSPRQLRALAFIA